ncbi:DUF6542 domain-containing protein [Nocardioides sp.]|uniref:DUF6542 domain-containing protein n=1 Tax=Nocardioides sp. TaxID=35761 RepID=UPI002734AE8C|nr:DUF6542 domain-containing protein [Nocardioides sp.]MDP3894736.1 hypothetical protein [Nocardioides sp.]
MSQARTLWEEGNERGRNVVALGLALTLTVVVLDLAVSGRLGLFFDLSFVMVCGALALLVRPADFFTIGVLPPLLMVGVFTLLGVVAPAAIADPRDGAVQAVFTGLAAHSVALVIAYSLCLGFLAIRQQRAGVRPRSGPGRLPRGAPPPAHPTTSRRRSSAQRGSRRTR